MCANCTVFSTNCSNCSGERIIEPTCGCPSGTSDDLSTSLCPNCSPICLTCTTTVDLCDSCAHNRELSVNNCAC